MLDAEGWPYQYQVVPVIDSISPAIGSLAGGTRLTITGRGFPTLSHGDTLDITAAGAPCVVSTSNYSTIVCTTGAQPQAWAPPSPVAGLYPGSRGLEAETYLWPTAPSSGVLSLLNTSLANHTTHTGDKWVVQDRWELPGWYDTQNYASRMRAFFTAPKAGEYRFLMVTDDFGHLNGTWLAVRTLNTLVSLQCCALSRPLSIFASM